MGTPDGYKYTIRFRAALTEEERSLVAGTVLGDGCLSVSRWKKREPLSARLLVGHAVAQQDLVYWKYERLKRLVLTPPREVPNPGYSRHSRAVRFSTRCAVELLDLWKAFYGEEGRKEVTNEALAWITHPVGLATWYADDGSRNTHYSGVTLHTEQFPLPAVRLLSVWLRERWGVAGVPTRVKKSSVGSIRYYWVLRLQVEEGTKLLNIVRPHLASLSSMHRKLRPGAEGRELRCSTCGEEFQVCPRTAGLLRHYGTTFFSCEKRECRLARRMHHHHQRKIRSTA